MREQNKDSRNSALSGVFLTVVINAGLAVVLATSGYTYLDPPPPDKEQILIEFEEVETVKPKQRRDGTKPRAEVPSKEIPKQYDESVCRQCGGENYTIGA